MTGQLGTSASMLGNIVLGLGSEQSVEPLTSTLLKTWV